MVIISNKMKYKTLLKVLKNKIKDDQLINQYN